VRRIYLSAIALIAVFVAAGVAYFSKSNIDQPSKLIQIPFTLTEHNNICIEAELNDKHTLALMFHTGNSNVCLTQEATEKIVDLVFDEEVDVKSWGGASSTRYSSGNVLKVGDYPAKTIMLFEDKLSGQGTDGKFGPDLFEDKIIEIDFDQEIISLHASLPDHASTFQKFECRKHRNSIFIEGQFRIGDELLSRGHFKT
jgi:hypothetical protein